jgi:hypothetical protein
MRVALLGFCIGLVACAQTYPNGAVETAEQATEIAQRECGDGFRQPRYSAQVHLKGDQWTVVWGNTALGGLVWSKIDASTGKQLECVIAAH